MINGSFESRFRINEADLLAHRSDKLVLNVHNVAIGSVSPSALDGLDGNVTLFIERLEFHRPGVMLNGPFGTGTYFAQLGTCIITYKDGQNDSIRRDLYDSGILFISSINDNGYKVIYQGSLQSTSSIAHNIVSMWDLSLTAASIGDGDGAIEIELTSTINPVDVINDYVDVMNLYGNTMLAYKDGGISIIEVDELDFFVDNWEVGNKAIITRDYDGSGGILAIYFNDDNLFLGLDNEYSLKILDVEVSSEFLFFTQNRKQIYYQTAYISGFSNGNLIQLKHNSDVLAETTIDDYGTPLSPSLKFIRATKSQEKLLSQDGECNVLPSFDVEFHGSGNFPGSGSEGTAIDILLTDLIGNGDFIVNDNDQFSNPRPFLFATSQADTADVDDTIPNDWIDNVFYIALQGTNFIRLFIPISHGASLTNDDSIRITLPQFVVNFERTVVSNVDVFSDCNPKIDCPQKSINELAVLPTFVAYAHIHSRHADSDFPYIFNEYLKLAKVDQLIETDTSVDGRNAIFVCEYSSSNNSEFIEDAIYHENGNLIGLSQEDDSIRIKIQDLNDQADGYNEVVISNPVVGSQLFDVRSVSDGSSFYHLFNDSGSLRLVRFIVVNGIVDVEVFSTVFNSFDIDDNNIVTLSYAQWDDRSVIVLTGLSTSAQVIRVLFDPIDDMVLDTITGQTVVDNNFSAQTTQIIKDELLTWYINWTASSPIDKTLYVEVDVIGDTSLQILDLNNVITDGTINAKNKFSTVVSNQRFMWMNFAVNDIDGDVGCVVVFDRQQQLFGPIPIISKFVPRNLPMGIPSGERNSIMVLTPYNANQAILSIFTVALKQDDGSYILPTSDETGTPAIGSATDDDEPGDYDIIFPFNSENNLIQFMIPAGDQLCTGYNPCEVDTDCGLRHIAFVNLSFKRSLNQCEEV